MTPDTVGLIITIGVGAVGLAVSLFFGLRSFTGGVGDKIEQTRKDVVVGLSDIKQKLERIDTTTDHLFQLVSTQGTSGTITVDLEKFGKTKVTAEPGEIKTKYTIQVDRGVLKGALVAKLSKSTDLASTEMVMFNQEITITSLRNDLLVLELPSTDPNLCTEYMSIFLRWLDREYSKGYEEELAAFEGNIKV